MDIEIRSSPFARTLYGQSGPVPDRRYAETGMRLMDRMWQEIRDRGLRHHGVNHWVYDAEDALFVGVELTEAPEEFTLLERRAIDVPQYAHHLHVGPYHLLGDVHHAMCGEIRERGLQVAVPAIEVYGHWTENEAELETEVLIAVN